jgi:hypothetical protein
MKYIYGSTEIKFSMLQSHANDNVLQSMEGMNTDKIIIITG